MSEDATDAEETPEAPKEEDAPAAADGDLPEGVVPEEQGKPEHAPPRHTGYHRDKMKASRGKGKGLIVGGAILVVIGVILLIIRSMQEVEGDFDLVYAVCFVLLVGGVLLGVVGMVKSG